MVAAKNKEEMIERGMVPLGQPGNEARDAEVRAKAKGVSSAKASISQKVRMIKNGTTKDVDKAIMELVRDPETSAVQLTKLSNEIIETFSDLSSKNKIALLKVLNDRYKTLFGGKLTVDADLRMSNTDKVMDRLVEWKANGGATPTNYKVPEDVPEEKEVVKPETDSEYEVVEPEVALG